MWQSLGDSGQYLNGVPGEATADDVGDAAVDGEPCWYRWSAEYGQ
jgi:hypothetical protein